MTDPRYTQQAPLTPEYQKIHEASMADQAKGGLGNYPTARCLPGGMPRMMTAALVWAESLKMNRLLSSD
jgi:hypothetical protein